MINYTIYFTYSQQYLKKKMATILKKEHYFKKHIL